MKIEIEEWKETKELRRIRLEKQLSGNKNKLATKSHKSKQQNYNKSKMKQSLPKEYEEEMFEDLEEL